MRHVVRALRSLLRLYPGKHREAFGEEMLSVMRQAAEEPGVRGLRRWAFFIRELAGILAGAAGEWWALLGHRQNRVARLDRASECDERPGDAAAARRQVSEAIAGMTAAIASSDFRQARAFSDAEIRARARLDELNASSGLA